LEVFSAAAADTKADDVALEGRAEDEKLAVSRHQNTNFKTYLKKFEKSSFNIYL
jgi:hypothetical protein